MSGYGGMATNTNWTKGYLKNDAEIKSMFRFSRSAKSKGMNVWLYDEDFYPSGMAGGYILEEHPDWEVEGLLFKDSLVTGPLNFRQSTLPGTLLQIKAVPIFEGKPIVNKAIDLKKNVASNLLNWNVPEGNWRIAQISTNVLRDGFQAGTERGGKIICYPSLLMPEVTERFIELTHKKYASVLQEKLGTLFYATFTDEPSLMAQTYTNVGYGVYPWKKNFSLELENRFGYKLEDKLLTLFLDTGYEGQKLRYQYFSVVSEMMSQNYFKAIREYCWSQNMKSGGHLLLEESMMAHVPLYGDIMACYREMDIPGIDVLTAMPEFTRRYIYSCRLAASAAELAGRTEVMSEICPIADPRYHNGKEAPTNDAKGTINRQLVGGVTRFNNYLQLQHATQAEKMRFNTYVARVSSMLSGGVRASKIAVLYPIETMWTKYRPLPTWIKEWDDIIGGDPEARKVDELFDKVSDHLYENQWEFNYIDSKTLVEAKTGDGKLIHGKFNWQVLILPAAETLPKEAWKTVELFLKSGGRVIAIEALPKNSETEFPSQTIQTAAGKLFTGNIPGNAFFLKQFSNADLQRILSNSLLRDFSISPAGIPLLCSHKKIEDQDVFFVANDSNRKQAFTMSFSSGKRYEVWNPDTGEIKKVSSKVKLELGAYDGIIVRTAK